jgi:hypothetical protein
MRKPVVFLGGTVGNNNWREQFAAELVAVGVPAEDIFNPVVKDWNDAARLAEEAAKKEAAFLMFYIANPQQEGLNISAYSLVEGTMGLYDKPEQTVIVFDLSGIDNAHVIKAMNQCQKVLKTRFPNANIFGTTQEAVQFLGKQAGLLTQQ